MDGPRREPFAGSSEDLKKVVLARRAVDDAKRAAAVAATAARNERKRRAIKASRLRRARAAGAVARPKQVRVAVSRFALLPTSPAWRSFARVAELGDDCAAVLSVLLSCIKQGYRMMDVSVRQVAEVLGWIAPKDRERARRRPGPLDQDRSPTWKRVITPDRVRTALHKLAQAQVIRINDDYARAPGYQRRWNHRQVPNVYELASVGADVLAGVLAGGSGSRPSGKVSSSVGPGPVSAQLAGVVPSSTPTVSPQVGDLVSSGEARQMALQWLGARSYRS